MAVVLEFKAVAQQVLVLAVAGVALVVVVPVVLLVQVGMVAVQPLKTLTKGVAWEGVVAKVETHPAMLEHLPNTAVVGVQRGTPLEAGQQQVGMVAVVSTAQEVVVEQHVLGQRMEVKAVPTAVTVLKAEVVGLLIAERERHVNLDVVMAVEALRLMAQLEVLVVRLEGAVAVVETVSLEAQEPGAK